MTERPGDINLPFEPNPEPVDVVLGEGAVLASGVVVMAAMLPLPGDPKPMPCLVFRFANPDGSGFYPPTVLACSQQDLAQVPVLVASAAASAISAAEAGGIGA